MNDIEIERELKSLRKYAKVLSKSKKKARDFLFNAGIITKSGKLRKIYGG